jgi:2-keto-4-pentenoate hydratase
MTVVEEAARAILGAHARRQEIGPIREQIRGVEQAYAVQTQTVTVWRSSGRRTIGHKIGLTSQAVQQQLGVDQPDFGVLFEDMLVADKGVIPAGAVMQPRVEAEIAFVLARDLNGEDISIANVIDATDYVCPALEICGSRIAGWDIRIEDTIADNASAGLFVLGSKRSPALAAELPNVALRFLRNDELLAQGKGSDCLGSPAAAVAWLARTMTSLGDGLKAGNVIMSGALTRMTQAAPGETFRGDFGAFGTVTVKFA